MSGQIRDLLLPGDKSPGPASGRAPVGGTVQDILQPGTTLEGRYRLVSEAAPQDLGNLYRGYDTVDDQLVMVLVLPFEVAAGSDVLSHFSRVQRAVAALGEPHLVVYEYGGIAEGRLYLVRRQINGIPLADLLTGGQLDATTAVAVTIAVGELVTLLHRAGMVHGGLSPHCVYVDTSSSQVRAWVTDCGLLPTLREVYSPPGRPWGRPPYLSPEQAAGEDVHPASDVYVLGALLYTMLAGRPPFRAADETVLVVQHLRQEPPALDVLLPDLSPTLAQIVQKALAKEPAARYRNAGQLAQILRSRLAVPAVENGAPLPPGQMRVPPPPRGRVVVRADEPQDGGQDEAIDWVMVALIIAALLAMFGLIQLWRTVYERYTMPAAAAASSPCCFEWGEAIPGVIQDAELLIRPDSLAVSGWHAPHRAKSWLIAAISGIMDLPRNRRAGRSVRDPLPGCGVKITGFAASLC